MCFNVSRYTWLTQFHWSVSLFHSTISYIANFWSSLLLMHILWCTLPTFTCPVHAVVRRWYQLQAPSTCSIALLPRSVSNRGIVKWCPSKYRCWSPYAHCNADYRPTTLPITVSRHFSRSNRQWPRCNAGLLCPGYFSGSSSTLCMH